LFAGIPTGQVVLFFHHIIINMDIDDDKIPVAHRARGWDLLVRWWGSMEWSNSQKEPTKNRINHGQKGGGKLQSTIATISAAGGISLSPNSNIRSFE
jgi:hypothetical protein